jgi:hypothetical protein
MNPASSEAGFIREQPLAILPAYLGRATGMWRIARALGIAADAAAKSDMELTVEPWLESSHAAPPMRRGSPYGRSDAHHAAAFAIIRGQCLRLLWCEMVGSRHTIPHRTAQ